jgi:hypothetical protein
MARVQLNVDVDAALKRKLMHRLIDEDRTLRQWMDQTIRSYLRGSAYIDRASPKRLAGEGGSK